MKRIFTLLIAGLFTIGLSSQNLVLNPDFEQWDSPTMPTGWTHVENVAQESTPENVHGGTYSAKHTGGTSDLGQTIAVEAGKTYEVSIWYKVVPGDGTDARIWSVWQENGTGLYDFDSDELRGPMGGYLPNGSGEWLQYSTIVTAPANATDFYFEVRTYSGAVVYYDDFSFEQVTIIDNDPPVWEATYPKAGNVEDVQFDLLAQLDETSTVYYVVLDDAATAPSVTEVIAGTGSAGAAAVAVGSFTAGTSETTETVTGLTVETSYDVYVVAEDDEATPNVQDAVKLVEITTVVMPDVLLKADFETDLSPFTAVSVLGDQNWEQATYSGNSYANISGYSGGAQDNDDYLISPAIDLDGTTDNKFSFVNAMNYSGPGLQVLISTDFSGTYDATAVGAATWTDISTSFSYSGGSYAWVESGNFDLSAYSGTVYIAFRYLSNPADGAAQWQVDDFMLTGFLPAGSDATLSDLMIDGTSVAGFEATTYNYKYQLPAGTTTVPTVTYTTTDNNATALVTPAADLTGDAAARTTTVEVTAQDGTTTLTYSIVFNPVLEVANLGELRASADESRKYIVTGEVLLSFQQSYRNKKYVQDGTGGVEIDDSPGVITTTYTIGDGITGLEGTVEEYRGMLQFHPTADPGAATSTGNTLTPTIVTPAMINANIDTYESTLVTVEEATISEADGTEVFADGTSYALNGVTESMVLRVNFYGTTLTGEIIPDSANVTGIVIEYNGTAQISPRSSDDVVELIEYIPSTDATLNSLEYDGTAVDGFSPAQLSYFVTLAQGTTEVPVVTATTTDENASVNIIDATDLTGDAVARTTSVEVTAEDGVTMKTYTIEFTVAVSAKDALFSSVSVYPIPAVNTLYLENAADIRTMTVFDITGSVVLQKHNAGDDKVQLDVASLDSGVYVIRMSNEGSTGVVRFVKQ